jgi:ethanolamine utilization protein EutN
LALDELRLVASGQEAAAMRVAPATASEPLVAYDELGAGLGSLIAMSEGGEAAQPFYPAMKPVDAYAAALLDELDLTDVASASRRTPIK